jgi:hypothetical protein
VGATWDLVADEDHQTVWSEVLVPAARELDADARELSVAAVEHVRAQLPSLLADKDAAEENRASTEAGIRAFAALVTAGAEPATMALPPATVVYAQASVRRGDPLPALLRSYRLAVELVWQAALDRIAPRCADQNQLLVAGRLGAAWLFGYMDVALTRAEELYDAERSRWVRSAAASQTETIEALLAGRPQDAMQASARLRYALDRHHVAALAWLDGADDGDPLARLEAAVEQLARATGAESVLVEPVGLLAVTTWLGRPEPIDLSVLDDMRLDQQSSAGVRVAVGESAVGVPGFRASHTEAGHARRVATLAGRRPGTITRFDRVALAAIATADADLARAFVTRELGPLAADDDVTRRLVATLGIYLEESASRSRAARRLGIHDNTVSYRVRQAEELLGRSVEHRTLELRVALALRSVLPAG